MCSSRFALGPKAGLLCLLALHLLAGRPAIGASSSVTLDPAARPWVASGILLDLAPDLAGSVPYDGIQETPPATPALLRQLLFQANRAAVDGAGRVQPARLRELARQARERRDAGGRTVVPLALLDLDVQRVAHGAVERGLVQVAGDTLRLLDPGALEDGRLFAAAALVDRTGQGKAVTFRLPDGEMWIRNRAVPLAGLEVDFADGAGFRRWEPGGEVEVRYSEAGPKTLRLRATWADGDTREARLAFTVDRLETPQPSETWDLLSAHPYQGSLAGGTAYILLAPGHTSLTRPVVLCEGFDMDNTMFWEELYGLGNQQGLVDSLLQRGFDMVVLNFDESTDAIQRNGLLLATLLEQMNALLPPGARHPLIGASMGGLVSRYALAWLEQQDIDPQVRTFISFDSPQAGANIPLSIQHWLAFFASESEEAAYFRSRLQTPAARQMLRVFATSPPSANPGPDPLRQTLLDDLAALGGYPAGPRLVAVANGSGTGLHQGFTAGAQIIRYEYRSWLVDIDGNCWSLADQAPQLVFRGMVDQIWPLPDRSQNVNINGAPPWDNAPGGYRDTMVQLDQSAVPYGDIVALHANHCFIPTTSALGLETDDPFRPLHGAPDLFDLTPFDALYYPLGANEDHVSISPESLGWFLGEIAPELPAPQLDIQVVEEGIRLSWDEVPLALSYRLWQSPDPAAWPVESLSTVGTEWWVTEPGERMFYRVAASLDPVAQP